MAEAAGPRARPAALRRPGGGFTLLGLHLLLAAASVAICVVVWAPIGGTFWPVWVILAFGICLGLQLSLQRSWAEPERPDQLFVAHVGFSLVATAVVLTVWAVATPGDPWPTWTVAAIVVVLLAHALARVQLRSRPEQALTERVDELTRSRRGALDAQAAELRRIERDLHDGAQARLVALSMQLGRAEHRLGPDSDPQTLDLLRAAREEARLAIAELRDLARGIAPPVLADRGLTAAVEGLGRRSPLEVRVDGELDRRPPPVVESAAYFVVAEALTNAAKHSEGSSVRITIDGDRHRLRVVVADDGRGGADPTGNGLSGLAQRAAALDGTLQVSSPPGRGTTVVAELPCVW